MSAPPLHRFPCPGCSADMEFDPASGAMLCRYCGRQQAAPEAPAESPGVHRYEDYAGAVDAARLGTLSGRALEATCNGCGGTVVFQPPEVAGTCAFCAARIVAQPKASNPMIAPDMVLPAAIPQRQAAAQVKDWLASRWFAPNALKSMARQDGIGGVYLPFWSYAAHTNTRYRGERGEYYYVTESYAGRDSQGRPVTRTRQVRRTRWHPAAGRVERDFSDVLISATRTISPQRLDALEPWGLENLRPYDPAFLSGFKAQRYQVEMPEGFESAKEVMQAHIEGDVRDHIGGDEQRIHEMDTDYRDVTFRHLLLPVWIGAYRFQNKVYQVLVNARTGEVQGERPYSAWKIAGFILLLLFALLVAVWLGK